MNTVRFFALRWRRYVEEPVRIIRLDQRQPERNHLSNRCSQRGMALSVFREVAS
jgi:hypothetical protein